jgi:sortase (surface protein transpeptidase)
MKELTIEEIKATTEKETKIKKLEIEEIKLKNQASVDRSSTESRSIKSSSISKQDRENALCIMLAEAVPKELINDIEIPEIKKMELEEVLMHTLNPGLNYTEPAFKTNPVQDKRKFIEKGHLAKFLGKQ